MFITNAVKTVGCIIMLFGTHPLLAYAIVGLGAAAYSPAKYGILTELLPPEKLVKANGWIEGLTVASIILGTGLGGLLISPMVDHFVQGHHVFGVHNAAQAAIAVMIFVYAAAAAVNLLIPDTGARYPKQDFRPIHTLVNFGKSCSLLWHDKLGQISLSVTTLFWGAGATLQFLVLAWADSNLGLDLSKAAILQGVVAIGIAIGAVLAAAYVSLRRSVDVLPIGVLMGFSVAVMSFIKLPGSRAASTSSASISRCYCDCLLAVSQRGHDGRFLRRSMNALLQHRGHVLMSAGRSIAVQNFNENSSILVMLGLYSLLIKSGLGTVTIMVLFGCFVGCSMLAVIFKHHHNQSKEDSLHLIGEDKRH
ncbi:MAG: lysophospholipid transporter LplT [Parasutterella sp.]